MFAKWGSIVHRRRWPVLVVVVVLAALGGLWGFGVFGRLSQGGYDDPGSEAARAANAVAEQLGRQSGDVVVVYTPQAGGIDDPAVADRIRASLDALPKDVVHKVVSYWNTGAPTLADAEHRRGLAVITLAAGDDSARQRDYKKIADRLSVDGVTTQVGGVAPMAAAVNSRSESDLTRAEVISLPVTLLLLVVIFGGLVAASLPVVVGGLAILGSLGVLRALTSFVDVNSFAVNVATLLGLGLAIDYGLFTVGRFREELAAGRSTAEAVRRTVGTSGRTVAFSATLLVVALAGLLLFPQAFLRSVAYGGMAAVAIAALVSLTLLPAVLALLGPKVDAVGLPWRRRRPPATDAGEGRGWARLARGVMRRPVLVALPIVAVLVFLGAPFLSVKFGEVTEKVLPSHDPVRQAVEVVNRDFPGAGNDGAQIVLRGRNGAAPDQATVQRFVAEVERVPGVTGVRPTGAGGDVVVLTASLPGDPLGDQAKDALRAVRDLSEPPDTQVLVGGLTARVSDSLDAIADRLPLMAGLLVVATLVLMFLAFGSVLLPIKAVVMSALSLSATFGVLVWVFQDGHGASLLGVTPGPLEAGIVVLMAAVVFGLSTDYETFLLSRMVEARGQGATTEEAISTGLARTGRMISAAALLLIIVTGAFAFSEVAMMRFVGVGMILALALDATVVRMLLVPAVIKLLGRATWWAPGPLRRLQQRVGVHEGDDLPDEKPAREPQPVR
ncbi:MMPL family transporter [Streptoalloteichus hindustanus]|uniref:Putative drug exporter of the RND superfamily n=1 Tax=Streptoalloteichus hindustanus TaxID=2017 RepID=A0A1M4V0Z9_STRHI|nr:MMPL family transporter [Streptoalloteichus hindustanus]SHE62568.1 putative drug exporter of the RND superfamily [Streptoalloteichus hindustanus]